MSTSLHWLKSSHSSDQGGACLEVATTACAVHVRDSRTSAADGAPALRVAPAAWAAFVSLARR
ncbi:DUF397 domain-containing protein [Streptomyces sp. NPDC020801]|uniref:DUF397 domain-containing protein n=1 Tax=Streptomyces sp. NPDC020801 TaxID=3365093 RepID=UPI0037A0A939